VHGEGNGTETRKLSTGSREKKAERWNWMRQVEGWKGFKKSLPRNKNEDREVDHILRIFQAYETVTASTTVRACWEKTNFTYQRRDGTFYLVMHEGKNSNSTELSRDLRDGLSDRKPIGEAEESEVGVVEPRILPNQMQEAIKSI
jgi:hypothetical protein